MKAIEAIELKEYSVARLLTQVAAWRTKGKTVAFTNGCFDILHEGHIASLSAAAKEADYLIVGLNSDASVKQSFGVKTDNGNDYDEETENDYEEENI